MHLKSGSIFHCSNVSLPECKLDCLQLKQKGKFRRKRKFCHLKQLVKPCQSRMSSIDVSNADCLDGPHRNHQKVFCKAFRTWETYIKYNTNSLHVITMNKTAARGAPTNMYNSLNVLLKISEKTHRIHVVFTYMNTINNQLNVGKYTKICPIKIPHGKLVCTHFSCGFHPWDLPGIPPSPRESPGWSGTTLRCGALTEPELGKPTTPGADLPIDGEKHRKVLRQESRNPIFRIPMGRGRIFTGMNGWFVW